MEYDSDLVILKHVPSSGSKVKKPSDNSSIHVPKRIFVVGYNFSFRRVCLGFLRQFYSGYRKYEKRRVALSSY